MRVFSAFALTLALAGCATLSKEECLNGNWEEIGFRDGTNGKASSFIQSHAKACEKAGVRPVQSLWEKGRQRGLPAYCVPSKAYSEGRSGRSLNAVCPAAQLPALRAANASGLEYYEYTSEMNEIQYRLNEIDRQLVAEKNPTLRAALVQEGRSLRDRSSLLQLRRSLVASF